MEIHDHRGHIHHVGYTINVAKNPRCHCLDKEIDQLKHSKKSTDFIKFSSWKQSGYKDKWLVAYKTLKLFFFFFACKTLKSFFFFFAKITDEKSMEYLLSFCCENSHEVNFIFSLFIEQKQSKFKPYEW